MVTRRRFRCGAPQCSVHAETLSFQNIRRALIFDCEGPSREGCRWLGEPKLHGDSIPVNLPVSQYGGPRRITEYLHLLDFLSTNLYAYLPFKVVI